nr:hypothetical protein BaRGS_009233 [Batillaria attramentaria]
MLRNETFASPRPRRTRHDSSKHYDAERKDLGLTEVMGVLEGYADYGGGINCSVCGKLYKSRVCFIKHLWEHTKYWDLFAGDKNHMRVLSIQAALILYGSFSHPELPVPVDNLLVTSPNTSDHPPSPSKDIALPFISGSRFGEDCTKVCPSTPKKVAPADSVVSTRGVTATTDVLSPHNTVIRKPPSTPVKKKKTPTCVAPPRPMKKSQKRTNRDSTRSAADPPPANVGNFFVTSAGVTPEDLYWKEADAYPCKRKRSE